MNTCRAIAAFALSIVVGLQATSDRRREHAPLGIEVDVHIPQSGDQISAPRVNYV
jgi:hypothetical protein